MQTDKTSTEVNIEVIAKEDEPTGKISKMAKSIGYSEKTEEEPKKVTYFRALFLENASYVLSEKKNYL